MLRMTKAERKLIADTLSEVAENRRRRANYCLENHGPYDTYDGVPRDEHVARLRAEAKLFDKVADTYR